MDKKNLPAMPEMWVRSLSWGVPLEKEMATLSSILAWEIPWTEEPGGLQSMGVAKRWTLQTYSALMHADMCPDLYMYTVCDIIYRVAVISLIEWV